MPERYTPPRFDTVTTETYSDALSRLRLFTEEDISAINQLSDLNRLITGVGDALERVVVTNGHQELLKRGDLEGKSIRWRWDFSSSVSKAKRTEYAEVLDTMVRIQTYN